MSDSNNLAENHSLIIRKNDYILLVVDDISLSDVTFGGFIFILVFILIYVALIIWAHFKDKQKQTYSSKVASNQSQSVLSVSMPRRANFRATNIDITSDTLDFTNQSVRMNFDDPKDMSAVFHQTGIDGFSVISPIHKPDSVAASPINNANRKPKFNLLRTPPRSMNKIDLESSSPHLNPRTTANDEENITTNDPAPISKDDPITSKDTTINRDDITLGKEISHIIEDMTRDDEILYKQTHNSKRNLKRKAKESAIPKVLRARQTIKSKFLKLLGQRHSLVSTVERMSRISPRYKRISLMYFLLSCNLFVLTLSYINFSMLEGSKFLEVLKVSAFSWVVFIGISWLSSVSKDGLKYTKTNDEFQRMLASLEKEAKYKDVAVHIIMGVFLLFALTQYALFISVKREYALGWVFWSVGAFLIQMILFDALWLLGIACIYTKAYDSQTMKRWYRRINSIRFWRI